MCHLYIAVEEHIVFCVYLRQRLVVAFGKAPVLLELYGAYLRKLLFQHLHGIVGRGIVGDIYRGAILYGVLQDRGQELLHHTHSIPVEYHYCYLIHSAMVF